MNSQHRLSGTRLAKYHQPLWGGLLPKIEADICQNTDSVRASGSKPRFCLKFEVHHRIRPTAQLIEKNLLAAINRVREAMARYEKIGAFGLTEPEVGSGASRDLTTTARRDGDSWVLTGQKKWIGNATFGGLTVIWAGMKSVGTPSGCQAAVTATEGRVWPQWFPGAPPSNSTG